MMGDELRRIDGEIKRKGWNRETWNNKKLFKKV